MNNSKILTSSSQELGHEITETGRKERERKREQLNAPIQSPHFQTRSGTLNPTAGTFSHGGMMDYPSTPMTEWKLEKIPDSTEFQGWKYNFRTKFVEQPILRSPCSGSKKLRVQKSTDELVTSRSITGHPNFLDFDMLDAMIASALKKHFSMQSNFRRRVGVEEQRAQNSDRFLTRKTNCVHEAVQGLTDLVALSLQNDDVQDFDVRWDHALLTVSEMLSLATLEGVYKSK